MDKEKSVKAEPSSKTEKRPVVTDSEEKDVLLDEDLEKVAGGIITPRDAASGLATGKRTYKPFVP